MRQAVRPAAASVPSAGQSAEGALLEALPSSSARPVRSLAMVLAAAAIGASAIAASGGGASARSWGQLATLVALLLLLWPLALGGIRIPRLTLIGAAVAAGASVALRLVALDISEQSFVVAQLREDSLQADSKILRDRMRGAAPVAAAVHVGTISRPVADSREAQALIDRDPSIWGVAWGTPRWTTVTLRTSPAIALSSLSSDSYARRVSGSLQMSDAKIAVSVPALGISDAKLPATGEFLGRLAQLWPQFSAQVLRTEDQPSLEVELRSLAALQAPWTSNAHRALPMWMTGTLHLVRAVSARELEEGELLCAVRAFNAALSQLRAGDNRELRLAIRNNLAIATRFRGGVDLGVKQSQAQARAILEGSRKKKLRSKAAAGTGRSRLEKQRSHGEEQPTSRPPRKA